MQARLIDLVKRLAAATDRRRGMDPVLLGQLDATVAVLQQDHQVASQDDDILGRLGEVYGLDSLDLDLLLIAVATDLDANIALAYGMLRGGSGPARPSIGLALELAGVSSMSGQASGRLGASSELRRGTLLDVSSTQPWLSRELSCPDRVIAHLQGNNTPEPDLAELLLDPVALPLPGSRQIADALEGGVGLVWIHAPIGSAGMCMAAGALREIGVRALAVEVPPAATDGRSFLRVAVREAALQGRVLLLDGAERLAESGGGALSMLSNPVIPVVAASRLVWDGGWAPLLSPLLIDAPQLDAQHRDLMWRAMTGDSVPDGALIGLRLSPDTLAQTARYAQLLASASATPMTAELIRDCVRRVTGSADPGAGPGVSFADLVLAQPVNESIHRLVGWARHREQLVADGLLLEAGGSGRGITALFSGSPGTGKTLAAHVVAAELGLDIMRVDLAAIVDKYIGETQKNLERVFHQAESLNVVLFFDEADALFGRRSEVKDSHDRYANQEVAYLLQRMEQFDGITILATNLRGNLDPAFSRRLSFIVHFPDPDVPTRSRLWRSHLARLGEIDAADPIDADHLAAAVELTGGDIRNIVVAAGYDAAIEGTRPGMRHVVAATIGEYSKLGRRVPSGGFHPERPQGERPQGERAEGERR
jgi:predicted nucleic acid-binding protein